MPLTHRDNGDGTVTQFDDTGRELVTFPDPDGSFTRNHLEPIAAATATAAPEGSNAERVFKRALELSPKATVAPDGAATIAPEAPPTEFQKALVPPTQPAAMPDEAPAEPRGISTPALPVAGQETTGLTDEDRAARSAARKEVGAAEQRSNEAQTAAEQQSLDARTARVQSESDRALGRYASDLELHELAKQKVADAEQYVKQVRSQPVDPGQALGGNKFLYAIMAGVGASLSNFGAALLHQQGHADTNVVDDIIADSVKQQMADRQLKVEGGQDSLDAARKEELRLQIQANASLEKWFEAKAAVEKDPEVRAAYAANAEERNAALQAHQFALAEKEYNTAVQKRAVPKPVKGAGSALPLNAETKEDQAVLAANGIDQEQLTKYGTERQKLGADVTLKHIADVRQIVSDLTEKGSTDVPGVGPIDEHTQSLLRSNDASKVQQALGQVVTTFVKNRSGAAVTDKEREYLNKILVGSGSNQREALENGLKHVEAEVGQQLDVLNSSNPGAGRAYEQLLSNRRKRSTLSEENAANLAAQRKQRDQPPAAPREKPAPVAPAEATPDNVAEFLALPERKGPSIAPRRERKRTSREEELNQLLGE